MEPTTETTPPTDPKSNSVYITIDQFIREAGVALTNGQLPEIEPLLAARGYPKDVLIAEQTKFDTLSELNEDQKKEYGESYQATADYNDAEDALHENYIDHLELARVAFKKDVAAQTGLGLKGKRKTDDAGYCSQALLFYKGVLGSTTYKAAMLVKGVTDAELAEMKAGFDNLTTLAAAKAKEGGEAQQATSKRNVLYDELHEWYADFKIVGMIALRKFPQLSELMGWKDTKNQ